jgi:radical SAM superfamily enzyme YgiQ (UPF0313 family)
MKVGLVSPKRGELIEHKELAEFFRSSRELSARAEIIYKWPELGLLTLAALMPRDYQVKYIDEEIETIDFDEHFDLIGITALTPKAARAYEIAEEFRRRGVFVIMGGPHASVLPGEAKKFVDSVFVGEAQNLWNRFMKDFNRGNPRPVYDTNGGYADMKKSPVPRYDLLNVNSYKVIPIETTRGCPHDCEFCSSTRLWGRRYRSKSIGQVLTEVEEIKRTAPRKFLFFVDDNMFVKRRFSCDLLKELVPQRVRWFTQSDISIARDDKLLDLMYQAGCREVLVGFETLSKKNLQDVDSDHWKIKQLDKYPRAIEKIQSYGISIYGSFVLGMDNDDETVFKQLRDFILETKLMGFQILTLTPIPGTRVYRRLQKENRLLPGRNWGNYSTYQINYKLKKMTKETMENGILWLFKELYHEEAFEKRKKHFLEILRNLPPLQDK